jgi:hypothetical protein
MPVCVPNETASLIGSSIDTTVYPSTMKKLVFPYCFSLLTQELRKDSPYINV